LVSDIPKYVSVAHVLHEILPFVPNRPQAELVQAKQAFGRVAARDIVSREDVPPMNASHMDGYAIKAEDAEGAAEGSHRALPVAGEVVLGRRPRMLPRPHHAVRVATGSYLPTWTDTVVPVEDVSVTRDGIVLRKPVRPGQFVFEAGGDIKKGDVLIRKGVAVRAQEMGLLITLGMREIPVFRRPRVAILATGSELVDSASARTAGGVKNSHVPVFVRLAEELGCEALDLGIARDVRSEILSKVKEGLARADLVLTTGGTSVGRMDLGGDAISSLRPRLMFHGIRMDRGRVTGVALVGLKPIVMMPGPIQGAMNAFVLFGLPIMRRLSGVLGPEALAKAELKTGWEARARFPSFTKVVYVHLSRGEGGLFVAEVVKGETESMTMLARSNGVLVVPEETRVLRAGDVVDVLLLPGFSFV
jgi:molybdopterin molybdotransferase